MGSITREKQKEIEQLESEGTKYCNGCQEIKPLFEFLVCSTGRKLASTYCILCQRSRHLQQKYGITLKEYKKLFKKQSGQCAICGTIDPKSTGKYNTFSIDHDHKTGKIRGLLCSNCNCGLGFFDDNPRTLIAAANYLMQNGEET